MNKDDLSERFISFAVRIIKLSEFLTKSYSAKHIGKQLVRSGTSIGANYEEAKGGESKADFIHKLNVAIKEARETLYWLKILKESEQIKPERLEDMIREADEICAILVSSVNTTKKKGK